MSEEPAPARRVSNEDRDYIRRLGEFEAENARDELARHWAGLSADRATSRRSARGRAALCSSFGRQLKGTPADELARTLRGAGLRQQTSGIRPQS